MSESININHSVNIISLDGMGTNFNAMFCINERYEIVINIYSLPLEPMKKFYDSRFIKFLVAETPEKNYITIFDAHIISHSSNVIQEPREFSITIKSRRAIIGSSALTPDETFSNFIIKITDGCELIGVCPYEICHNDIEVFDNNTEIKIPINHKEIIAETKLGKLRFYVHATKEFSNSTLIFSFDHEIYFDSKMPITYNEFHSVFEKITTFFEILCGELVTVNELRLYDGDNTEDFLDFREFRCIGYTNYPQEKLRWLNKNNFDSVGYLRGALFKISDFNDIAKALDYWFVILDKTPLATGAYQRILLDEDVEVVTENKFLAAMQLIEGYTAGYSDNQKEIKEFNVQKSRIKEAVIDTEDKEFIEKYCTYSGEIFRKMLKSFTCEGLVNIQLHNSKTMLLSKIDNLLGKIKNARDIYTHSASEVISELDAIELFDIAVLYKYIYRINVLLRLGISEELLIKRLNHCRLFTYYLERYFQTELRNIGDNYLTPSNFDNKMWSFSNRMKQKTMLD
jgi:hypothetical protein